MVAAAGIEVVDAVGVVPEDAEILRGGLHAGEAAHGLVGKGQAAGIAVHGHADDALHRGITRETLDHIHVRAAIHKRHGDALDAEHGKHVEVPVVARHGAEELEMGNVLPRRIARERAVEDGAHEGVVDEVDAGIAADDHLLGRHAQQRAKEALGLGDAGGVAVVARVHAVFAGKARVGHAQHGQGKVELARFRLAARHVQMQAKGAEGIVAGLQNRGVGHCFFLPEGVRYCIIV